MTDDDKALVERLRDVYRVKVPNYIDDAADRIEALISENERLKYLNDLNAVPAGIIEDRGRMEERDAIIAWMMRQEDEYPATEYSGFVAMVREEIEAGEHLK